MNWIKTQNNTVININEIPTLHIDVLRHEIMNEYRHNKRAIGFFGVKNRLFTVLADDFNSQILVSSAKFFEIKSYSSLTPDIPAFSMFEREFFEEFNIEPAGHPWLKPVRKIENYNFLKSDDEEVHEVAVGPIHAGIIEPGHFRFLCRGEFVENLEIQLGYQHRNIESLFLQRNKPLIHLAESVAGDTVIGHATAYCNALEALTNTNIPEKSQIIRAIALEMERIAVHIGDLGAVSNDIAYLMGTSVFGATRTLVINTLLEICGSRFARGLIRPGGVAFDIDQNLSDKIYSMLDSILTTVEIIIDSMFSSSSVLSRLDKTGIVSKETAHEIGLVGMAARASGVPLDIRADHPWGSYKTLNFEKIVMKSGDVYARTYIRYIEIKQSAQIIRDLLAKLPENADLLTQISKPLSPNSMVISLTEGWRGEIVHTVLTDEQGNISRYKIKDPSFNNWNGLALAVKGNGISDFPLCNKSFNLSYCGNDL
ncbi:MAG: hypothetical protein A2Y25_08355 [Candidatus Melainabacteria bacterium GWF2_37_15]|nr:MAG: hypothetical protein A2Y25_08355 [Candidatus Melainabacteria bacterium GWF2_37_15]